MDIVYTIDLLGTLVFAISGVLAASEHRLDLFGAGMLGLVTAIGGGAIRDMMIGATPVAWLTDNYYQLVIFIGIMLAIVFKKYVLRFRKTLFLFDAIGIGLFTILGLKKALAVGLPLSSAVIMGMVSAVFGGIIRDVLVNEIPLIFRKDFYATVCLLGGVSYLLFLQMGLNETWAMHIAIIEIITIRILAVKYHWRMPKFL